MKCEMCESTDAEERIDPFIREVDDEEVYRALCDDCYQNRKDDI